MHAGVQHPAIMNRRARRGVVAAVTACGLLGGVACSSSPPKRPSKRKADAHAVTAGVVMQRSGAGRPPVLLNDAAWQVVGTGSDDTIEALRATGTTWSGEVVLRITVQSSEYDLSTTCYRYHFTHSVDDGKPLELAQCPSGTPVALSSPVPEPVVDTPARLTRLTALLHRLTAAQLADPASVRTLLPAIFPPPIVVAADRFPNGTLEVGARTFDTCVTAYVTAHRQVTVHPGHGTDCRGG